MKNTKRFLKFLAVTVMALIMAIAAAFAVLTGICAFAALINGAWIEGACLLVSAFVLGVFSSAAADALEWKGWKK